MKRVNSLMIIELETTADYNTLYKEPIGFCWHNDTKDMIICDVIKGKALIKKMNKINADSLKRITKN